MAEAGEVKVRITADTGLFEQQYANLIDVLTITALREVAFIKNMSESAAAAFGNPETVARINDLIPYSAQELMETAQEIQDSLATQPSQGMMDQ